MFPEVGQSYSLILSSASEGLPKLCQSCNVGVTSGPSQPFLSLELQALMVGLYPIVRDGVLTLGWYL